MEAKFRDAQGGGQGQKRPPRRVRHIEFSRFELLDRRFLPAVSATFSATHRVLTIGNAQANSIVVSRSIGGTILVNSHAVTVLGARPTVANTKLTVDNGSIIAVAGLLPVVNITGAEATTDTLTINAVGDNDMVDASNLAPNLIGLTDRRRRGRHTGWRRRGRRIDRRTGSGRARRRSWRQHPDPGLSRICSQCVRNLCDHNSRSKVSGI